jgi:hypothetical protein
MEIKTFTIEEDNHKAAALNTIYPVMASIAQELRQMVERLTITGCGLIIFVVGWFLSRVPSPTVKIKVIITLGILLIVIVATAIIRSVQERYQGVAQIIRNINDCQSVHVVGAFLSNRALFPETFKRFGTTHWKEPIFLIAYVSWIVVMLFAVGVVWVL